MRTINVDKWNFDHPDLTNEANADGPSYLNYLLGPMSFDLSRPVFKINFSIKVRINEASHV